MLRKTDNLSLRAPFLPPAFILFIIITASPAAAQYKNSEFGFRLGGTLPFKGNVLATPTTLIVPPSHRPLRLGFTGWLEGESGWKMQIDRLWWIINAGLGVGGFTATGDPKSLSYYYDSVASSTIGMVLTLQGGTGFRYYFLTDTVRPYLGFGLSYMHIFSLTANDTDWSDKKFPSTKDDYPGSVTNLLPHLNLLRVHAKFGIEFIVHVDIALALEAEYQYWVEFGSAGNQTVSGTLGFIFYY